jgi:hypothetical protein
MVELRSTKIGRVFKKVKNLALVTKGVSQCFGDCRVAVGQDRLDLCTSKIKEVKHKTRGQCYEHNFEPFSPIFCDEMAFFLENQCTDNFFLILHCNFSPNRHF